MRIRGIGVLCIAVLASGCAVPNFLNPDAPLEGSTAVQSAWFATPAPVVARSANSAKSAPSSPEMAIAVDKIGRQIVAANPSIGMRPAFSTIGTPMPEIFHQGTTAVFITEGLVRECKTEAQIAAVLSVELGRMVAEREVLASPEAREPEKSPPINVAMGNSGQFSGLDQLQQAETAKLGVGTRRPSKKFVPPDAMVLARDYLQKAGFDRRELDQVTPLLSQAERNYILEKQFNGSGDGWQK